MPRVRLPPPHPVLVLRNAATTRAAHMLLRASIGEVWCGLRRTRVGGNCCHDCDLALHQQTL